MQPTTRRRTPERTPVAAGPAAPPINRVTPTRVGVTLLDLSAYTPGSVPAHRYRSRGGDHLSRTVVADGLQQPTRRHEAGRPACCSVLLRVGFTEPTRSPAPLVSSYLTFSPLPPRKVEVVCFLWHCPSGYPGWLLAITLPCGARTFLERFRARPPGRQIRIDHSAHGRDPAIGWSPC